MSDFRNMELVAVEELKPCLRNARTHTKRQEEQCLESIERFGFTSPLIIDDDNMVLAGHLRLLVAPQAGYTELPCIRLSNMADADKRAYMLIDNKLTLNGGWDRQMLAIEFKELEAAGIDLSITGFEIPEIDIVIDFAENADAQMSTRNPEDLEQVLTQHGPAVTSAGDIWLLGRHSLVCGNARSTNDLDLLMDGALADCVFTDPPWNVPVQGHIGGNGRIKHREFTEASGEMTDDEFADFLNVTTANIARACKDGAIAYFCIDWRHSHQLHEACFAAFDEFKNLCVWNKGHGGMGSFYRSQHELIYVWKKGTAQHRNNFGLGEKGRTRTNVWSYPGMNSFGSDRLVDLAIHPTCKNVDMIADALLDVSKRGEVVLDAFGGSGSTLIAAERTGRCARLLELDPSYCDVIVRRWQNLTGKKAIHEKSARPFCEIERIASGWTGRLEKVS